MYMYSDIIWVTTQDISTVPEVSKSLLSIIFKISFYYFIKLHGITD